MSDMLSKFIETAGVALWGVSGGVAHLFVSGKKPTFYAFLYCVFVSGFAGLMVGRIMEASAMPQYLKEFSIGMAGFGGPVTLNLLYKKMVKATLMASDKDIEKAKKEVEEDNQHGGY